MKRILSVLFCIVIICCCFGCTVNDKVQPGNNTVGLKESVTVGKLKFTATEIEENKGTEFFKPEDGKVFVGINFEIENISQEEQSVSSLLLFEAYVNDVKCAYSFSATCAFPEGTLDGDVAAGKKLVGWYAMEVPSDWKKIEVHVRSTWLSNNSAKFVFQNNERVE